MPMAAHFAFKILEAHKGQIVASAEPSSGHYNPFHVAQGGFAATVLDIVLGLVSITMLTDAEQSVATTDLVVRYFKAITERTGVMTALGTIIHAGSKTIAAESKLHDGSGRLYALAQSTSLILASRTERRS